MKAREREKAHEWERSGINVMASIFEFMVGGGGAPHSEMKSR
jgi:hypothetical protein